MGAGWAQYSEYHQHFKYLHEFLRVDRPIAVLVERLNECRHVFRLHSKPTPPFLPLPIPRAAPRRPPSRLLHTGTSRFDQHAIKPSASQQRRGTAVRESGAWGTSWGTHGVLMGVRVLHGLLHGVLTGYFMGYSAALTFKSIPISRKPEYSSDRDSVLGANQTVRPTRPMCAGASLAAHAPFALGRRGHERMRVCVSVRVPSRVSA
jgi:hypothetical protein